MCGIAGLTIDNNSKIDRSLLKQMIYAIEHRGPAGQNYYFQENIGLGHCQANITNKKTPTQPFNYQNSNYQILFDGTIYNDEELRHDLLAKGYTFTTNTLVETVLVSYLEWGKAALTKLNGMWALAIYNNLDKSILLARDRFGSKPLYYFFDNKNFGFASEYKSFLAIGNFLKIEPDLRGFHTAIQQPTILEASGKTLIKNVYNVLPGHFLYFKNKNLVLEQWLEFEKQIPEIPQNYDTQQEMFFALLKQSCRKIKSINTPAGFHLSSGIDSSTLVGIFSKEFNEKINTFHIKENNFFQLNNNGLQITTNNKNIESNKMKIHNQEIIENIDNICHLADNIQPLPSYKDYLLQKKLKMANYSIAIAGHGADEIFGSYHNNFKDFLSVYSQQNDLYEPLIKKIYKNYLKIVYPTEHSAIDYIIDIYDNYTIQPINLPKNLNIFKKNIYTGLFQTVGPCTQKIFELMGTANGLEVRMPYLDNKLVNFVLALPDQSIITPRSNKSILRDTQAKIFGKKTALKKQGFFNLPDKQFIILKKWIENIIFDNNYTLEIIDKAKLLKYYKNIIQNNKHTPKESAIFWRTINALKLYNIFFNSAHNN